MESIPKSNLNGVERQGKDVKVVKLASSPIRLVLRLLAVVATLAAAVMMAVDKETKTVNVTIAPTLPPLPVVVTAKATNSSAFLYFIIANAIACAYSAILLVTSIVKRSCREKLVFLISAIDLLVVALLFSAIGAATAMGVVGRKGDSHAGWNKICDGYELFCAKVSVSICISLLGSLAHILLALLNIFILHRSSP